MAEVQMQAVDSSDVAAIGYDEDQQEILVDFVSGHRYAYGNASRDMFASFAAAGSKGQFVHRVLKRSCPAREV